jgi:hypothetical protein
MQVPCPGTLICITPAHAHISFESPFNIGMLPNMTVGAPITHVPAGTGMHGIGVGTPSAAAVAAITIGLAMLVHMPNGGTLTIGAKSMMVAAGMPPTIVRLAGSTTNELGATPKLQSIIAPEHTHRLIASPYLATGPGTALP